VRGSGTLERLRRTEFYAKVEPYLPKSLRKMGARFAVRPVKPAEVPAGASKDYLRTVLRPKTDELCRLLDRTFPEWTCLYDTDHSVVPPGGGGGVVGGRVARATRPLQAAGP
jgi:hypothetical protein